MHALLAFYEARLENAETELRRRRTDEAILEKLNEALEVSLKEKDACIEELSTQLRLAQGVIVERGKSIENLHAQLNEAECQVSGLLAKLATSEKREEELNALSVQLNKKLNTETGLRQATTLSLDTRDKQLAEVQNELNVSKDIVKSLRHELDELKQRMHPEDAAMETKKDKCIGEASYLLEEMWEMVPRPPKDLLDEGCTCFISAPCGFCVEGARQYLDIEVRTNDWQRSIRPPR